MTQLYNVSFTTRTIGRKYDAKGKEVGTFQLDQPVTLSALPYATAMSYKIADNFKIEPYVPERQRSKFGSGRDNSVGNGAKMRPVARAEASVAKPAAKAGRSRVAEAAASGNLGAALNV